MMLAVVLCLAVVSSTDAMAKKGNKEVKKLWDIRLRGVTMDLRLEESDMDDLAEWGANSVRLMLRYGELNEKEEPYGYREEGFKKLDRMLDWCEERDIRCIIDMHEPPGKKDVCLPKDRDLRLWKEFRFHDILVETWEKIAERYASRGKVVAAYDILNEPNPMEQFGMPEGNWNKLARRIVKAIRKYDETRPVIIEPTHWADPDYFAFLKPVEDPYAAYSFHFYKPFKFTTQGVNYFEEWMVENEYPGKIDGRMYDKKQLEKLMKPAIKFQKKHGVEIYCGEFSAVRYAPNNSAYRYIRDCIEIFEKYGFHWSYHGYREWTGWSAEHGEDKEDQTRSETETDRFKLLKKYFMMDTEKTAESPGEPEEK